MSRSKQKGSSHQYGAPSKPPPDMRDEIAHLKYPARTQNLVQQAESADLSKNVIRVLGRLRDHEYGGPDEVVEEAWRIHGGPSD